MAYGLRLPERNGTGNSLPYCNGRCRILYLNREIGRLIQIIILLLIVCAVYKLANLIFTSISLVSRLPVIRSADKLFGAVFGILEGIIITGYILYWLKNWGLSVLG